MSEIRAAIVAEASRWIRTPYRHRGRIRGVGVDCAMLAAEVYAAVGLIPPVEEIDYPPDWHHHRDDERYMDIVLHHAREIDQAAAGPGDLVLIQIGRAYAHGAIITERGWPYVIHAWQEARFVIEDRVDGGRLVDRPCRFFSLIDEEA